MAFKKILLSVLLFAVSASYSFSTELLKRYFDGADHDVFITCVDYTGNPLSDGELLEITFDSWKNALDNYVFNYYEDYPFKEYTLKNIREDIQKFYEWNKNCVYVLNFENKKSEYFQEYLFVKEFEDGTVHCLCTWWVKIHGNSVR